MPDTRRPQGRRFADTPQLHSGQQGYQDDYGQDGYEQDYQQGYGGRQQYQQSPRQYQRQRTNAPQATSRQRLACKKCGSSNVTVSVDHTAAQRKKNGCFYWVIFGVWHFFYWLFFKMWLNLYRRITNKGSKTTVYKEHKTAICQDCGYSWKL